MGHLEAAYAQALLSLAQTPKAAEHCGEVLLALAGAVESSAELRGFLLNPVLPKAARRDVLVRLAPKNAPEAALNCVRLMVDKGRIASLPGVAREYKRLLAAQSGVLVIKVRTAAPLGKAEEKKLCAHFAARFGAEHAAVETVLDPTLIGGARVQVGDMLYDQSLFGRLEGLRRAIGDDLNDRK